MGVQLAVRCTGGRGQRAWRLRRLVWDGDGRLASPFLAAIGVRVDRVGRPPISGTGARVSSRTRPGSRRPSRGPAPPEVPRYRAFRQCCSGALSSPAGPERRRSARYTRRRRSAAVTHLAPSRGPWSAGHAEGGLRPIASYVFASAPAVGGGACGRERSWTAAATGPIRTPAGRRWCAPRWQQSSVAVLGVSVGALAGCVSRDAGAVAAGAAAPSLAWVVGWVEQPAAGCRAYREAWVAVGE